MISLSRAFSVVPSVFSTHECDLLASNELGWPFPCTVWVDGKLTVDPEVRSVGVRLLEPGLYTEWVFARLLQQFLACTAPSQESPARRVWGLLEPVRLMTYGKGDHFGWHTDYGPYGLAVPDARIMACTVLLTDPAEFEGGDLYLYRAPGQHKRVPLARGDMVMFRPTHSHLITKLTAGVRQVLVTWAHRFVPEAERDLSFLDLKCS